MGSIKTPATGKYKSIVLSPSGKFFGKFTPKLRKLKPVDAGKTKTFIFKVKNVINNHKGAKQQGKPLRLRAFAV
jgi:hypothetical protein